MTEIKNQTIEYVGLSLTVQYGSVGIKHFRLWQGDDVILEGNNENTNLRFLLKCLENKNKKQSEVVS